MSRNLLQQLTCSPHNLAHNCKSAEWYHAVLKEPDLHWLCALTHFDTGHRSPSDCCLMLPDRSRTSLRGLVRMDMASFQPNSTMATIAHRGGSRLLAALLASCVLTACNTNHACSVPASMDDSTPMRSLTSYPRCFLQNLHSLSCMHTDNKGDAGEAACC